MDTANHAQMMPGAVPNTDVDLAVPTEEEEEERGITTESELTSSVDESDPNDPKVQRKKQSRWMRKERRRRRKELREKSELRSQGFESIVAQTCASKQFYRCIYIHALM